MRYGFHGTTLKALKRICREGLAPRLVRRKGEKRAVNAPAIFFAHSVDGAKAWGDVVLRFAFPENAEEDPYGDATYAWPGYTNWYTTTAVAPSGIEVLADGKFVPLDQACDDRRVGRASGRAGGQQAWDRGFYMEGACDVFALALASLSGLPLGALTDDKGFLRHVVVAVDRGHYADALGIHAGEVDERLTPRAVKGLFSTCGMSEAQIQKHVATAKRRILNDPELSSLISGRTRARAPRARGVW
jgi:hypothetical protein